MKFRLFVKLANLGCDKVNLEQEKRRLRLVNISSIFSGLICFFSIVLFSLIAVEEMTLFLAFILPLVIVPLILNAFGKTFLSRTFWIFANNAAVTYTCFLLGSDSINRFNFLPMMVLPMIFFSRRNTVSLYLWMTVSFTLYVLFEFNVFDGNNILANYLEANTIQFVQGFFGIVSFLLVAIVISSLHLDVDRVEKELVLLANQRQRVLSILFHDLYNPLSVNKMAIEFMKNPEFPDNEIYLEKIEKSNELMMNLIDQVKRQQDLSRKKGKLQLRAVSADEILQSSSHLFENRYQQKSVNLVKQCSLDKNEKLLAEPVFLNSVIVSNLLSNALKFSHSGSTVTIDVLSEKDKALIRVSDEGDGIDETLIPDLFNMDVKTSLLGTEGESGTGFGLPLVRTMVREMGGELKMENKYLGGKGVRFSVYLKKV